MAAEFVKSQQNTWNFFAAEKLLESVLTIRQGIENDLADALRLIKELAVFEEEPDAVVTTVDSMRTDGFGDQPVFGFFVAEVNGEIVGLSLYYDRYSTWRGRCLYLEDLIVTENFRGQGIGKALFDRTVQKAREDGYQGISWQVLDWNDPAIKFYETYGAKIEHQWLNCRLEKNQLDQT